MIKSAFTFILLCIFAIFSSCSGGGIEKAKENISGEDIMETVKYLSSKEMNGRLAGSEGYNRSAKWVAEKFERYQLEPAFDKSWFQKFDIEFNEIVNSKFEIIRDGKKKRYEPGKDYVCRGMTGSGNFTAPVVFCGYGISIPEQGYDDYKDIDVNNKIVMVFRYNPGWRPESGNWPPAQPRLKSRVAADKGALGIIFVSAPNNKPARTIIGSVAHGEGRQDIDFPQIHIDNPQSDDFFAGSGFNLTEAQRKIDSLRSPFSFELNSKAQILIEANYSANKETMNIAGIKPGNDPDLRNEYVVVGAHLDHVGGQAGKIYFPGANDNASGIAVILKIAKMFNKCNVNTKRSVIFVAFSGEESGLFGSNHFVENTPVRHEDIFAMINFDCVAQGDSIRIGGGKTAPELWDIARYADMNNTNLMSVNTWAGGGADATAFYDKGISTLYYTTTGGYKYLHETGDTPETLNRELFRKITVNALLTTYYIANMKPENEPKTLMEPE